MPGSARWRASRWWAKPRDAAEAFAQVEAQRPDLVLMDVGMKQTNGIELTARLRDRHPALRVLMLSMYDNPEYVHRALAAGASGYVLKEAPSDEIVSAIAAVTAAIPSWQPPGGAHCRGGGDTAPAVAARERAAALPRRRTVEQADRQTLGMSMRTVETHRQNIRRKLNLGGQAELIKYAVERCADPGSGVAPPSA